MLRLYWSSTCFVLTQSPLVQTLFSTLFNRLRNTIWFALCIVYCSFIHLFSSKCCFVRTHYHINVMFKFIYWIIADNLLDFISCYVNSVCFCCRMCCWLSWGKKNLLITIEFYNYHHLPFPPINEYKICPFQHSGLASCFHCLRECWVITFFLMFSLPFP